jgi:hypothetical protein
LAYDLEGLGAAARFNKNKKPHSPIKGRMEFKFAVPPFFQLQKKTQLALKLDNGLFRLPLLRKYFPLTEEAQG